MSTKESTFTASSTAPKKGSRTALLVVGGCLVVSLLMSLLVGLGWFIFASGGAPVNQQPAESTLPSAYAFPASLDSPVLLVGTGTKFEPMFDMSGPSPRGFDIDLAREIARRIGKDGVSFRSVKSSRTLAANGAVDMAIQAISIKPSREKENLFSLPYLESSFVIIANSAFSWLGKGDLAALPCAVGPNRIYRTELKKTGCDITSYKSKAAALNAVRGGTAAFTVTDEANAGVLGQEYSLIQPGIQLSSDRYGIAMQLGNHELKLAVDRALGAMRVDGTLDGLRALHGI